MKTLGERIKFHRKRMGWTQEQLAERMGVSPQAVSKWEHDQSCPDITTLPSLATLFGISVDELLGNEVRQGEIVGEEEKDRSFHWEWHPDSLTFPIFIMVVGGLLLFNHFMNFEVSWWTVVWTCALAFIGIAGLHHQFSLFSMMLVLAGAYFLLSEYNVFTWNLSWSIVLPAALLLWGVSLLIDSFAGKKKSSGKTSAKRRREYHCSDGHISCDLAFGEHHINAVAEILTGGTIDTSFGSFVVDFSGCAAVAPQCKIEVDNSFSHLTVLVPKRFAVRFVEGDSFTASVDVQGEPSLTPQGEIFVELDNSFGNFTVRYIEA